MRLGDGPRLEMLEKKSRAWKNREKGMSNTLAEGGKRVFNQRKKKFFR